MSSNSRFGEQTIVNSFNLFVDTERANICGDQSATGDDAIIHFEGSSIVANDGELIKLTLTNFEMYNNTYNVDVNNDRFTITHSLNATPTTFSSADFRITDKNYATLGEMAIELAKVITRRVNAISTSILNFTITINHLFANTATTTAGETESYTFSTSANSIANVPQFPNTNNAVSLSMSETCNRLLDIKIVCKDGAATPATLAHGINTFNIQSYASKGDFANLFGGLRQDDNASTSFQSLKTTFFAVSAVNCGIRIQGFFPMQRTTDPYVYLRCNLSQSGGLESATLASDTIRGSSGNSDLTSSNILAKLKRDVEFISYDNATGNEYFINLQQRKLSTIKLYLTDSKNRPLGRRSDTDTGNRGTCAGLQVDGTLLFENQNQSTLGNLFYTAVLRVDIIKMSEVKKLETAPLPLPLPARKAQVGVVSFQSYGLAKSGD